METSIYVHFPFCVRKCFYCDFNSVGGQPFEPREYVSALLQEMKSCALTTPRFRATTLFFGGGTPSLMPPELVADVVEHARELYSLSHDAEVTLEANPGTISYQSLIDYRLAGVNRLSLGIQSFDDHMLSRMGRIHSAAEGDSAVAMAREAGFTNIGIDLIHSLPGQTLSMWESDLRHGLSLAPEHISAYALSVEEGTPFGVLASEGNLPLPDEDVAASMFDITSELLTGSGYEQYEISNFARPGFRSRHNQVYWQRGNYLGFGAGAHSFLRLPPLGCRWENTEDLGLYIALASSGAETASERQVLTEREALSEVFFLGLRMLEGVDLRQVKEEFGLDPLTFYANKISRFVENGQLLIERGRLFLAPSVRPVANQVFLEFL